MTRTAMIVVPPARGHLNHGIALARLLARNGHRPFVVSGAMVAAHARWLRPEVPIRTFANHDPITESSDKAHRLHGCFQACPDCLRACLERTSRTVKDQVPDPLSVRSPHWVALMPLRRKESLVSEANDQERFTTTRDSACFSTVYYSHGFSVCVRAAAQREVLAVWVLRSVTSFLAAAGYPDAARSRAL
jgi:hypothetical protein